MPAFESLRQALSCCFQCAIMGSKSCGCGSHLSISSMLAASLQCWKENSKDPIGGSVSGFHSVILGTCRSFLLVENQCVCTVFYYGDGCGFRGLGFGGLKIWGHDKVIWWEFMCQMQTHLQGLIFNPQHLQSKLFSTKILERSLLKSLLMEQARPWSHN